MAVINKYVQQSAGVDNLTVEQLNLSHASAGLYKLIAPISIYQDNNDDNIYYLGSQAGSTLYKEYDSCSVIMNSDVFHSPEQPNIFEPTTQILIPYNDTVDASINEIFLRYNNESGAWSPLTKISFGDSVRGIKTELGYYLVDNSDPLNPIVLSDRTKLDKIDNYSFTEGAGYSAGDIIATSDNGINAQVIKVDPNTGAIKKIALTTENRTTTSGSGAVVTVNTALEGNIVELDRYGNLVPSAFKASYVKPYEFNYQDSYVYELDFDEVYDQSSLAGGSSDYGFAYTPFSFVNFNYSLIDKATGNYLTGEFDFNHEIPFQVPVTNPGNLVWYGYVDTAGKITAESDEAEGYAVNDTFTFVAGGTTYNGTITDISQSPYGITTDVPVTIGPSIAGVYDTTTVTGSGTGLKIYISPSIVEPCYSINVKDIPDKSLVWSGVKVTVRESTTKIGTIFIPIQFKFDITVNGILTHVVEYGTITVVGIYGIRPSWTSTNYNTVTPLSSSASGWQAGDRFNVTIMGTTYEGQIDDTSTDPYTIHTNIPQTTEFSISGTYAVTPISPATGTDLSLQVDTSPSSTFKLTNTYVDPHGGYDPVFYSNGQVDMLLARQRVQAGTENNIMAFSGQEGRFNELIRTESINTVPAQRSHYAIPTEAAVGEMIDDIMDNDMIASMSSSWISGGEQLNLNKASGTTASSVVVPYANSNQDGLMKKEMYDKIGQMSTEIDALQGLDSIGAALGTSSQITQNTLNQAWSDAGKGTPVEGNKIINTSPGDNQGHNWMYLNIGGTPQWVDTGSGNVAIATNTIQGVVMGTEPASTYDYYSSVVKQIGPAGNFIGETLTTTTTGATQFTVVINNTDSQGNIVDYTLSPSSGATQLMLSNVSFTKQHNTALYYNTAYVIDASQAQGYVNQEAFTIDNITGNYAGYVLNATLDPILCITNIPSKTQTDISGTYTTTSTSGSGTGLKVIVVSTPYKESVNFRLNITSWENPVDTIEISDVDGHMRASGMDTLAQHVKFLNENKADKKEIEVTSNDGSILITKPEGFEDDPRFDLSFNLASSTTWITLTGLLDGSTSTWDITPYLQGISTNDLEFYYGDGILFAGIDYTFIADVNILSSGAGYEVGDILMLNNDTRSAKITEVGQVGEILSAVITSALPSTTQGQGADLAARFTFTCLKDPVMNSANGRTFMCKGTKLSLVSDLSGITNVIDPTGTLNTAVSNNTATIGINIGNVFRANPSQPAYINLTTPTSNQSIITQGSLINILQNLTNNVNYIMNNAIWKYDTNSERIEIAVTTNQITPKTGVSIIKVDPNDLGQIASN